VPAREFSAATRVVPCQGRSQAFLARELRDMGVEKVGLVADRGVEEAGLLDRLLGDLRDVEVVPCGLVDEDPGLSEVETIAERAISHQVEAVVIVGGGSALCAGKAAAMRLRNPAPLLRYAGRDRLPALPAPSVAVPTTAGSGSEVSEVVVLHDPHVPGHVAIRGRGYGPGVALLDGELLATLPRRPMILAALDALSHCYEALWSNGATSFTDALALAAAASIRSSLRGALEGDAAARQALIEASASANLACGNSGLAVVHALSSASAVRLPHGYQNGVLLPHALELNRSAVSEPAAAEMAHLPELYEAIAFVPRFATGELSAEDADTMVAVALENPFMGNNRRPLDEADLRRLMALASA
jgi:alcohol dehydrogenase class IV